MARRGLAVAARFVVARLTTGVGKHWPPLAEYLAGQEKQYIDQVLHASHGDKAMAAKILGVEPAKLG